MAWLAPAPAPAPALPPAGVSLLPLKGRIYKFEDISMGSWIDWVEKEKKVAINRVYDQR